MKKIIASMLSTLVLTTGVAFADQTSTAQRELEKKQIMDKQAESHKTEAKREETKKIETKKIEIHRNQIQTQHQNQLQRERVVNTSGHRDNYRPLAHPWNTRERYVLKPNTPFHWRQPLAEGRRHQEDIRSSEWSKHFPGLVPYYWQGDGFYYHEQYIDQGVFFYNSQEQLVGVGFVQDNTFVTIKEDGQVRDNDDKLFQKLGTDKIKERKDWGASGITVSADKEISDEPKLEETPKTQPNLSWNGKWKTSVGEMQVKRIGDNVECMINNHILSAKIIDGKIVGKWSNMKFFTSTETKGEFQFIMSSDGTFVQIKWKDGTMDWVADSTANRLAKI